jgi:RimJ/RimL family protein N-acetyltransferase
MEGVPVAGVSAAPVPKDKLLLRPDEREEAMKDDAPEAPILETERLRLRSFRRRDLDEYAALRADREVLRYLDCGSEPWDRGRSWRHMAFLLGHWQLVGTGVWAMEHRETGAFVGMVGYYESAGWPGFELAWTLARRWWGQGYATEGARSALDYALTVWKRDRVISLIYPENHPSIRVAERLGESLQDRLHHNGREMLRYGIDRKDYAERAQAASTATPSPEPAAVSRTAD